MELSQNQKVIAGYFSLLFRRTHRFLFAVVIMISCLSAYGQNNEDTSASDTTEISEMLSRYINFDTTNIDVVEEQKSYIGLALKQNSEGVILRWAPTTQELFDRGLELGYVIKRYEYPSGEDTLTIDEDSFIETWVAGANNPVRPFDSAQWASRLPIVDKYAIIAAGATAGSLAASSDMGFGVKAKQDKSMFGYTLLSADLSTLAADGLGFRLVDRNVRIGKDYEYRVLLNDPKEIAKADSIYALDPFELDSAQIKKWGEWMDEQQHNIIQYQGTSPGPRSIQGLFSISAEKMVELMWPVHENPGFSAYIIERSADGGRTYDSLTQNVFVSTSINYEDSVDQSQQEVYFYTDELDTNYVEYTYRVTAYDAFADRSLPALVKGMGRDLTPPISPEIVSAQYLEEEKRIRISWRSQKVPDDFADLHIEFTENTDSTWLRLEAESLDPRDSVYYHTPGPNEYAHYFRLGIVDTAGNAAYSFPIFVNIPDTIPPPPPVHLTATIDTTGQVIVRWEDELPDKEGFLGYRVFVSNHEKHEYSQLTKRPIEANFLLYRIPVNTLSEKIYYKVQAVDKHYNHSEFSESIEATKPDAKPPVAPTFRSPKISEQSVILSWNPSPSADLVRYEITKRSETGNPEVIQITDVSATSYEDVALEPGIKYYYTITAVDDADLVSPDPFEILVKLVDKRKLEKAQNLKINFNRNQEEVRLTWEAPYDDEQTRYVIYRHVDDEKPRRYQMVAEKRFTENIRKSGTYSYSIRIMDQTGARSSLSESVSVVVQ